MDAIFSNTRLGLWKWHRRARGSSSRVTPGRTLLFSCVLAASGGFAFDAAAEMETPVPTLQSVEIEAGDGHFMPSDDAPVPPPNHPPISEIPPMPMPVQPEGVSFPPELGNLVVHDLETGETYEVTLPPHMSGPAQGDGYAGPEEQGPPPEWGEGMATNMTIIGNTEASPWRMNVKLVMRWGTDFFSCSGTMRDAETVLTAAHCVHEFGGRRWADDIWVYPGWDGVEGGVFSAPPAIINPYGWGHASFLGAHGNYTGSGDLNYDLGMIGVTRAAGFLTGWFGYAAGGNCNTHLSRNWHNASYPAENWWGNCHTGRDMYYWYGTFDSCHDTNRLQLDTILGCTSCIWGGQSGSGAYYIDGSTRRVHAVTSTSNRPTPTNPGGPGTWARYARQTQYWVDLCNNNFIPTIRGSSFDLQPIDVDVQVPTIEAGGTTGEVHKLANPTNGSDTGTYTYKVYLSTNSNISPSDTLLTTQQFSGSFSPMSWVYVHTFITIPINTPPGDYYVGVIYDNGTDGNDSDNDTDGWDAALLTVTAAPVPPTADVTLNGQGGDITVPVGTPVTVTMEFDAASKAGVSSEYYIGVLSPIGWFWATPGWKFTWPPEPVYQGPLFSFGPLDILTVNAPEGVYIWILFVDDVQNGVLEWKWFDWATVTVQP